MKSPETLHVLQAESVVPHEGTWIEINLSNYITKDENTVVPHEGTWIEIVIPWNIIAIVSVVPHEGTWIEMPQRLQESYRAFRRSPRGNVD